ncbi:hypothetical protein [Streptomyces mirabilis]|uniref:hypothetical protein n=1 Tax=Streptomyces mirabilis TaxID=68239 RepID=UPI0036DBF868
MAQAAARNFLQVGKESYSSHLRKNMSEIGALSSDQTWRLPFPELFGKSLSEVLDAAAADLASALTTLGRGDRLARLVVIAARSQWVSAQYAPYGDGSGLVVVSDSLAGLCTSYCQHLSWELAPIFDTTSFLRRRLIW